MKEFSHLNSAVHILQEYQGAEPLSIFLKSFFSRNKKYGSRDRKQIAHLCYCYFRLGKAQLFISIEERILLGLFFCSTSSHEVLKQLKPEWDDATGLSLPDKISRAGYSFSVEDIFPFIEEVSDEIEREAFAGSHFVQPDLFLRLRPGKEKTVRKKLEDAGIDFETISETGLALPNASKLETVIKLNEEAVIQDLSSQRVSEFLLPATIEPTASVWDSCAASGGKSILLRDMKPGIRLTVSDIRESILANLKVRFKEAGINNYKSYVADLTQPPVQVTGSPFDLIMADVPCSGSGTWGRTPEQLYYFNEKKIKEYAALQQKIIFNLVPNLKPGGYFLYITCSVYKKENEEAVSFIREKAGLELLKMGLLKGYDKRADTMFAALLQKPL